MFQLWQRSGSFADKNVVSHFDAKAPGFSTAITFSLRPRPERKALGMLYRHRNSGSFMSDTPV